MFCRKCGSEIDVGKTQCLKCGAEIVEYAEADYKKTLLKALPYLIIAIVIVCIVYFLLLNIEGSPLKCVPHEFKYQVTDPIANNSDTFFGIAGCSSEVVVTIVNQENQSGPFTLETTFVNSNGEETLIRDSKILAASQQDNFSTTHNYSCSSKSQSYSTEIKAPNTQCK